MSEHVVQLIGEKITNVNIHQCPRFVIHLIGENITNVKYLSMSVTCSTVDREKHDECNINQCL